MDERTPERSEDGVDATLVRWFLTLTPGERLDALESIVNEINDIHLRRG